MNHLRIQVHAFLAALVLGTAATTAATEPPRPVDGNPRTIYFSTGDNQDLLWLPLDSRATIEAAFDSLRERYQVERIWWRGGQDEVWGKHFILREENRQFARVWQWWKHLAYEKVGTNRIAVKAAHDRGMAVWMAYGLFDNGSGPDVGYVGFPYAAEDKIRVEHPEWAPVNRFGTWHQGGPIEFCYPGARKAMVDYLTKAIVEGGYDGLAFLTYAENYSQRYEDEFGYNQPVVEEFKRRHGVDIRTQKFDKAAWSRLRGEYLTRFLRELHASLAKHGKKISVSVDGKDPHLPCMWNHEGGVRTAGRIHLDLETWVKDRCVDEINVYAPNTEEAVRSCHDLCKGTAVTCSVFRTRGELPAGAPRIMWVATEVESGFDYENYIHQQDEKIPPQPADALKGGDVYARRRLLTAVLKKKQALPLTQVTAAVKDPDVLVRRLALQALGILKDPGAVPAVEAALLDPENSVRWQAALVLGQLPSPRCVEKLFETVARDDSTFQFNFRAVPEVLKSLKETGKLGARETEYVVSRAAAADPKVRETALNCLKIVGAPATTPGLEAVLLKAMQSDLSPYARELALINVKSSFGPTRSVLAAVKELATDDRDAVMQMRAAVAVAGMLRGSESKEVRAGALQDLVAFFGKYGDGCKRPDADWGWREVGNAILEFGPEGKASLTTLMEEKKDRRRAELAWRVVYLRQGDRFYPITAEEDTRGHACHPFLSKLPAP